MKRFPQKLLWVIVISGSLTFLSMFLDGFDNPVDVVVGLLMAGLVIWAALMLTIKRRKGPTAGT